MAVVDFLWVGYFTLEMESGVLKFVDGFGGGAGGVSGARARRPVTVGQVGPPENVGERGPVQGTFGDLAPSRYPPTGSVKSQDEATMQRERDSGGSGQVATASTAVDEQVTVLFTAQAMYSCEFSLSLFGKVLMWDNR